MNYEIELKKEYSKIMKKLQDPNISESYLDDLLKIMSDQLIIAPNISIKDKRDIKKAYQEIQETNKKEDLKLKALKQLKKLWKFNEPIDTFQANTLQNRANIALDLIDIDELQETEDKDFLEFLELLISNKKQKSSYKIDRISDIYLDESEAKANQRLSSYFQNIQPKSQRGKTIIKTPKRKTHEQIIEAINNNNGDFDIPENYLNTFYVALRNTHLGQSDLNRIKSLVKSGSDMKEAIYSVVTNKSKRSSIERLVRKHQSMAIQLDEARKRLY